MGQFFPTTCNGFLSMHFKAYIDINLNVTSECFQKEVFHTPLFKHIV